MLAGSGLAALAVALRGAPAIAVSDLEAASIRTQLAAIRDGANATIEAADAIEALLPPAPLPEPTPTPAPTPAPTPVPTQAPATVGAKTGRKGGVLAGQ